MSPTQTRILIGGELRNASDDGTFVPNDPSTGEPAAEVAAGTETDIDDAVRNSLSVSEEWRDIDLKRRGRLLRDVAERVRDESETLAQLEATSNGKPITQAREEIAMSADFFEYYAGLADKIHGESIPRSSEYVNYTLREPLGIVGFIIPWNYPVQTFARGVSAALAAGNTAVVKPAEDTSVTAVKLGEMFGDVGFPDGVVNVVPGLGERAGAALAGHPDVARVSFTGSVETGRTVSKLAAENVTPVHLELGGKSPSLVYPDADIEAALDNSISALFTAYTGQCCDAATRLLVHEDIHDDFVRRLADRVGDLSIGPPNEDPDIGPMVSQEQLDRVANYIGVGREEHGEPIVGGEVLDQDGYFVEPTIFSDVDNACRIAQEEIFGPVLVTTPFEDEAEATGLANETEYGLAAAIFTSDMGRAHRFARDVDAGQVHINEFFTDDVETPFGGYKNSGHGRERGLEAINYFTQVKNVCANIE